jgi:hypothetical protein
MNSVFKVVSVDNVTLQEYKDKAITELNVWFNKKWVFNTPKIFIVDDRKTIDLLREKETENWVVGWSWGRNAIFILNPDNISKESSHDGSKYNIEHLIKHELCHSFFQMTFGQSTFEWINEGVAIYVAGQLEKYRMPLEFNGFLDGKEVYQESGNALKLLIDNYGKETLFEFLKNQSGVENIEELKKVFQSVYKAELEYSLFNTLRNKSYN